MADPISIRVLTESGVVLEEKAVSVIAPGEIGYFGVLRNHAPLVTTLKPGKLILRRSSGESRMFLIGEGLFEVVKNRATILTDSVKESEMGT